MRNSLALTAMLSVLMLGGCSQSADEVRVYSYGGGRGQGIGSLGLHSYRKGETLWAISKSYQVDLRNLLDINGLSAPYKIKGGDRLKIPSPNIYKVQEGDTLYKVSRMFDATTTDLARLNRLPPPYQLNAGQSLKLPTRYQVTDRVIKTLPAAYDSNSYKPVPGASASHAPARPVLSGTVISMATKDTASNRNRGSIEKEELAPLPVMQAAPSSLHTHSQETGIHLSAIDSSSLRLSRHGFLKPVSGKVISGYGTKADGLHNDGINIKATKGDAIRAAEQGVVVYSGNQIEGYGNMLLIRHAEGFVTAYAHMDKILVKRGDNIRRGQAIGTVGATGHVNSPQLHFEIRKGRDAVNPTLHMS